MRKAGLAPLPIIVQLAVLFVLQLGWAPGIAVAADAPAAQSAVPVAAPASAANPAAVAAPMTTPAPLVGHSDAGRRLYTSLCAYCHHLGDDVSEVGAPGLQGVMQRYGEAWLDRWLADPQGFSKSDAKAKALVAANPYGLVMPALLTMQDAQNRADVIAFLRQLEAGNGKDSAPAQ